MIFYALDPLSFSYFTTLNSLQPAEFVAISCSLPNNCYSSQMLAQLKQVKVSKDVKMNYFPINLKLWNLFLLSSLQSALKIE